MSALAHWVTCRGCFTGTLEDGAPGACQRHIDSHHHMLELDKQYESATPW